MSKIRIPESLTQYDLWAHVERQIRFFRIMTVCLFLLLVFTLFIIFVQSAQDIPVIRIGLDGSPELVSSRKRGNEPTPEEAEYVAREVATNLLEFIPGGVERDMNRAISLMSREAAERWKEIISRDPRLPLIDKGEIRSQITWSTNPPARIRKDEQQGVMRYYVEALATVGIYEAKKYTNPIKEDLVRIRVQLRVIPRSAMRLSGLLVESFDKEVAPKPKNEAAPGLLPTPTSPTPPTQGGSQ